MESKKYNQFPEGFKVPTLKKGEKVAFELLPDCKPPIIMPLDETVDIGGDLVDISVVRSETASGDVKQHPITFSSKIVFLNGNDLLHRKIYTQMMLSNHNIDNENRDLSKRARFKVYDPAGDARRANQKDLEIARAKAAIAEMTEAEVKKYFDVKGESSSSDYDILVGRLIKIAEKDPKPFIKNKGVSAQEDLLNVFVQANKKKLISFNVKDNCWEWADTGDHILQLPKDLKGKKRIDFFVPFLQEEKGREVYAKLKEMLEPGE